MKVARLETQVTRYRASTETLEKSEDELKAEKRKLQREVMFLNFDCLLSLFGHSLRLHLLKLISTCLAA